MDLQNASLVLKTSDLTADPGDQYGIRNSIKTSFTWYNINLRTVLGDMYDKYDTFNLCLNTISTGVASTLGVSNDDKNTIIKISGLPFLNQCYNVKTGSNTQQTVIATFLFTSSQSNTQYYYSNNIATFGKNQEQVNISIQYNRVSDDTPVQTVNNFPDAIFVFDIIGIPKDQSNKNGARLTIHH
jgi:hypothetical protein